MTANTHTHTHININFSGVGIRLKIKTLSFSTPQKASHSYNNKMTKRTSSGTYCRTYNFVMKQESSTRVSAINSTLRGCLIIHVLAQLYSSSRPLRNFQLDSHCYYSHGQHRVSSLTREVFFDSS
jgi:hypothetical protein